MIVQHVLFNIFDVPVCTINFLFIQTLPLKPVSVNLIKCNLLVLDSITSCDQTILYTRLNPGRVQILHRNNTQKQRIKIMVFNNGKNNFLCLFEILLYYKINHIIFHLIMVSIRFLF